MRLVGLVFNHPTRIDGKRTDPEWRPFTGPLTPTSTAYALTVVKNLFSWLVDQRYLLANPFSGLKVRGADKSRILDTSHAFTDSEWTMLRTIANNLERSHGWEEGAAHRARFILDFSYSTGLRPGELISVRLGHITPDDNGAWWVHGKRRTLNPLGGKCDHAGTAASSHRRTACAVATARFRLSAASMLVQLASVVAHGSVDLRDREGSTSQQSLRA